MNSHVASYIEKKARSRKRLGAALMNNTKWREVLRSATAHKLWHRVSLVGYPQRDSLSPAITAEKIGQRGVADPGLDGSGPIEFWEILALTFPRVYKNQQLDAFVEALSALGKIPVLITDTQVEITGYALMHSGRCYYCTSKLTD